MKWADFEEFVMGRGLRSAVKSYNSSLIFGTDIAIIKKSSTFAYELIRELF